MSEAKALARERVRGLWIAIPTPFTDDGRHVEEDLLRAAVEHSTAGCGSRGRSAASCRSRS